MRKVILVLLLCAFMCTPVHASSVHQVLEIFGGADASGLVDAKELEAQMELQKAMVRRQVTKYNLEVRAELTASVSKESAKLEYELTYNQLKEQTKQQREVEDQLHRAVNALAPLDVIFKLENDYRQRREKINELAYVLELKQILSSQNVEKVSDITYSELAAAIDILKDLNVEYDKVKGFADIGELFPKPPVSNNRNKFNSFFGLRNNPKTGVWGNNHTGLDIAAGYGDYNLALYAGVVIKSGWNAYGYGNYVVIDHGYGLQTLYAHAVRNLVEVGDEVTQYQPIQETGSTGFSTGPHLHLGVIVHGQYVDPYILWKGRE